MASTLTEWESLAEELKHSKRSRDQELYLTISENFLPVLPSVIASEEKLRQNRLKELEETRQSARIEEKRKEQELLEAEQEAVKKAEENKKREAHRKAAKREEEEKQKAADLKRAQKEEAKALLREGQYYVTTYSSAFQTHFIFHLQIFKVFYFKIYILLLSVILFKCLIQFENFLAM